MADLNKIEICKKKGIQNSHFWILLIDLTSGMFLKVCCDTNIICNGVYLKNKNTKTHRVSDNMK